MYTRSYYPEQEKLTVPDNYDGYAFSEEKSEPQTKEQTDNQENTAPLKAPWDIPIEPAEEKAEEVLASPKEYESTFGGLVGRFPFLKSFGRFDLFKKGLSDFGTEELLIIGIALFLLFSKSGDKECSLILLFLLFVK